MIDFIVQNYYAILVVCILLIFAIIGYIIDTLKSRKPEDNVSPDTYIPEEEIFIQKFEPETTELETSEEQQNDVDNLLTAYNSESEEDDSN